jgi:hypothetical protein
MNQRHSMLWIAGWAGLVGGGFLALIGVISADDLARFAGGYGLMTMAAAAYLLLGLGLRNALGRRRDHPVAASRITANQR